MHYYFHNIQETLLDYGFAHLGLNEIATSNISDTNLVGCVPHPIVMTEPPLNPNSSRAGMFNYTQHQCEMRGGGDFKNEYFNLEGMILKSPTLTI